MGNTASAVYENAKPDPTRDRLKGEDDGAVVVAVGARIAYTLPREWGNPASALSFPRA